MTRIEWLQQKHGRIGRVGSESRAERRTPQRLINITERTERIKETNDYKLALFEPIPPTLKPCGFYNDSLTESVWLPFKNKEGNVIIKPCVIMAKKDLPKEKPYRIIDFLSNEHNIKGTFPSQELQTAMSVKAVQMLEHMATIEPQKADAQIEESFKKHLSMPKPEMTIAKRWIEASFFYDIFDAFPIESILGVSESGKSRLCILNLALAYHGEGLIDPTEASIFRAKEEDKVSLIIDEAEYLNNPYLFSTIRILLNASYSKNSGYVTRYDEEDGRRIKRRFDLYSPMCISGIAGLEGVTLSRAFRIVMRRTNKDFPKAYPQDYQVLRDFLYVLRIRHCFEINEIYKKLDISNIVTARFEELFKPLFAITKFMGNTEEWEILAEWCKEYQESFRIEALNVAEEEMVLVTLSELTSENDWYKLKELTESINLAYNKNLQPKTVSNILYRIGITKRKQLHGYTLIFASKELLESCISMLGLGLDLKQKEEPSPLSSTTLPTSPTSPNWIQNSKEVKQ